MSDGKFQISVSSVFRVENFYNAPCFSGSRWRSVRYLYRGLIIWSQFEPKV